MIGVLVVLLALAGRVAYVITIDGPELLSAVERQRKGHAFLPARRGTIVDRRGRVVALTRLSPDVFVDAAQVKDEDVAALALELGARVGRSSDDIAREVRRSPRSKFVVVARRVDEVTAAAVREMGCPAVGLSNRAQRNYPLGASMAHVLGWVGRDGGGLAGIELALDEHLRASAGRLSAVHDARRRRIERLPAGTQPSVDGGSVVLTLDAEVQRITEEELAEGIRAFGAEAGVAIVLSPQDGEILAMACLPGFDPNEPATADSLPLRRHRAVTDPIEPGSTFKPIIVSAALEGGFVSPIEKIDCHNGSHRFGKRLVRDTRPHGLLDINGIVTKSSNIGMGIIAHRMGNRVLHDALCRFGFGERTNVGLPGESAGIVYPLSRWTAYSTTSIPIGYEVLVTPLQLANAFAALVNGGVLLQPRLVKALLSPTGEIVASYDGPRIVRRVASEQVAHYVSRELMRSVVTNGGGHRAQVGPFAVLGKTGTAKLVYSDRAGYEPGAYLSLFVGAAPASEPRIVTLVIIRRPDPSVGYYGGVVAAPAAGRILARTLVYLGVTPTRQVALSEL